MFQRIGKTSNPLAKFGSAIGQVVISRENLGVIDDTHGLPNEESADVIRRICAHMRR